LGNSFSAYGGAFIFGILLGWSSPAAPKVFADDYKFEVTKDEFSWIASMMALGAAFSTMMAGICRSRIGTKLTIVCIAFPTTIGWLLITFARNVVMVIYLTSDNVYIEVHKSFSLS